MADQKGKIERSFLKQGARLLGIDEVGRGCIAGPVYSACVSLNYERLFRLPPMTRNLVRDSKKLSGAQRQKILPVIKDVCLEWALGSASVHEIETLGIVPATFLSMRRAYDQMEQSYDQILLDGKFTNPTLPLPQSAIISGDSLCFTIAAASIIAKEARDLMMRNADSEFPGYGFAHHVGYGTKSHLLAMHELGITSLHRRNFAPVRSLVGGAIDIYVEEGASL
jgi:ribonuclease HII